MHVHTVQLDQLVELCTSRSTMYSTRQKNLPMNGPPLLRERGVNGAGNRSRSRFFLRSRSAPVSIPVLNCARGVPVHRPECTDPVQSDFWEPAGGSTHLVDSKRRG